MLRSDFLLTAKAFPQGLLPSPIASGNEVSNPLSTSTILRQISISRFLNFSRRSSGDAPDDPIRTLKRKEETLR